MSPRRGLRCSDLIEARHTTSKVTVGGRIRLYHHRISRPELAISLIVKKRGVAVRLALWLFVGLFVMPDPCASLGCRRRRELGQLGQPGKGIIKAGDGADERLHGALRP